MTTTPTPPAAGDAVQDHYRAEVAQCYGCGRDNHAGYQLRTTWDGDETVSVFTPRPEHTAIPGFVYGGLIASLVDCHGTGTAAMATYRAQGREWDSEPPLRFVTGTLEVSFRKPTPMGVPLVVRGVADEIGEKKVVMSIRVLANDVEVALGRVVAVRMPDTMAAS